MPIKNLYFRFSLLGTILAIIGVSGFAALGIWQTLRAYEKQELQQSVDNAAQQEPFNLNNNQSAISTKIYQKVRLTGQYDKNNEILIDNIVYKGTAGYHILTPFKLENSEIHIMINRGWVPVGNDRNTLPVIKTPEDVQTIHGIIAPHRSKPPLILGELDTAVRVWQYFDIDKYTSQRHIDLLPVVILLDENDRNGYVREWPKYDAKMGMHIGYAIQWYVFAIIVLVTYLAVNIKKKTDHDH